MENPATAYCERAASAVLAALLSLVGGWAYFAYFSRCYFNSNSFLKKLRDFASAYGKKRNEL
jgi:hypothetical protein